MVTVVDLKAATDFEAAGAHEIGVGSGTRLVGRALDPQTSMSLRAGSSGLVLLGTKHDGEIEADGLTQSFGKRSLVFIGPNEEVTVRNGGDELLRFATLETIGLAELVAVPPAPATAEPENGVRPTVPIAAALEAARSALNSQVGEVRGWCDTMEVAIERLSALFAEQVRRDDAPHGFVERSAEEAPRLIHALDRLRAEHAEILGDLGEVRARVVAAASEEAIADLAPSVAGLIGRIDHHLVVANRLAIDVAFEETGQGD